MINYTLTPHAKERMVERSISEKLIKDALKNPTKLLYDKRNRILIKKLYRRRGKERLLLIAGELIESQLKIITIITTSKIKKYL